MMWARLQAAKPWKVSDEVWKRALAISVAGGITIAIVLAAVAWLTLRDEHGVIAGIVAGLGLILFIFFGLLITHDSGN